jgi:hypothetical protein
MNAAFVGHGFHLKYTKSSLFFIELLKQAWPNLKVFAEEWSWVRLPRRRWDVVVFWQQMPSRLLLDTATIGHAVLVPMYDACSHDKDDWDQYRDCSIVCFSRALADLLEGWGHRVFRVQYFPPVPAEAVDWSRGPRRAFFWPRKTNLGWPTVRALLGAHPWQSVHLHVTEHPDELTAGFTDDDRRRYAVDQTHWFVNRQQMLTALGRCQVYFAPRRAEGIGMSFLEALALGMAVVAPDASTMNEYIVPGVNGYLYDPDRPVAPDWTQASRWGAAARTFMEAGRARWLASVGPLVEFLSRSPTVRAPGTWSVEARRLRTPLVLRYTVYLLLEPLRVAKRWALARFEEKR